MSTEPSYFNAYENFSLPRTASGVLAVRLHTNGGPITFTGATRLQFHQIHKESPATQGFLRCAREDSNLHGPYGPQGPQPCASTNSATGAGGGEYSPGPVVVA
jgi:hypothetical protein